MITLGIEVYFSDGDNVDFFQWEMISPPRVGDIITRDGDWLVKKVSWGTPTSVGVELERVQEEEE